MLERDGPVGSKASDGQYYRTLTHAGYKEEGVAPSTLETADAVWESFTSALKAEIARHTGKVLEWRSRPSLEFRDDRCWVRARLAFVSP